MNKEVRSFVTITAPREEDFSYFFSLNPAVILHGLWLTPKTDNNVLKKKGLKPGSEVLIYFDDGSTALYQLFDMIPEVSFSIHIDDFKSKRFKGLLAMRCHFSFLQLEAGRTILDIKCEFKMESGFYKTLFDWFGRNIVQKNLDKMLASGAEKLNSFLEDKMDQHI